MFQTCQRCTACHEEHRAGDPPCPVMGATGYVPAPFEAAMKVAINAYVPEDGDFIDEGWAPMTVIVKEGLQGEALRRAVIEALSCTEVTAWRWPGERKTYEVSIFG